MRVTQKLLRRVSVGASWANRTPSYRAQCRIKNVFISLEFADVSPFTDEGYTIAYNAWEATKDLPWAMTIARIINQTPALAIKDRSKVFKALVSEHEAFETLPDELLATLLLEGFIE